ncbi:Regulator of rDNA transcription protein 15 [Capsicum baccatum]|uniref:Regulator of rDNA transcription protein 15 n=1 Tax=Capsicum baccatum TaxID=33114 RepID=A0A2G2UYD6_CAPBA|nr:Regulator of rDNA transcription protein 15 [Capsicum baccatum]
MSMQGAMAPRCLGAMAPWCLGALVPWCHGATVPWCLGAMVPRCHGATVPWCLCAMASRSHGALVPWCLDAMAPRCLGAMAPCCQAAWVLRCTDIQLDKDTTIAGHYTSVGVRHCRHLQHCTQRSQKPLIAASLHAPIADIEGSKSNVAINAWLPQASYPCGNFSDTSSFEFRRSKGSLGHAFTVRIRTGNQNQTSFYPSVPHEISVLVELILGHLRYLLTDVPPQPNSPPDNVFRPDRPAERALGPKRGAVPRFRFTE